jgi:hypothetical protein
MISRTFASFLAGAMLVAGQATVGSEGNGSTSFDSQRPLSFEDVKKYLVLSDSQMEQLLKLADERASRSQGNYDKVQAKRAELDGLLRSGSRDVTRLGQLTLDIYTLSNDTPVAPDEWRHRAVAILNPQQRTKLEPLEQATKLAAAASQAVALNLVDAPPPPAPLPSPMPLLPDPTP